MYHPTPTLIAGLSTAWVILSWAITASQVSRDHLKKVRPEELLALGFVAICALGAASFVLSYVVPVPLALTSLLILWLPVLSILQILKRGEIQRPTGRSVLRHAPLLLLIALPVAATLVSGVSSEFRTDQGWRTDAVKELVWSNSVAVGTNPPLPPEMPKYAGYLATRAAVTYATGEDPSRPTFGWVAMSSIGMAAATFGLARNIGLTAWGAGVAVVALPLLGGDSYRLMSISDARGTAAAVLICGLMLSARGWRSGNRTTPILLGGAIAGLSAIVHLQFMLITASLLIPMLLLAYISQRWVGETWKGIGLATVAALAVMVLALPQATTFRTESLAQTAQERTAAGQTGQELAASGATVWPPQRTTLDGVRLIYVSPHFFMMDPAQTVKPVWNERMNPILALVGIVAAALLRRKHLTMLLAATVLLIPAVLLNPVLYPMFARFFGVYRTEYIGFELGFLALAAAAEAAVHKRRWGIPLAAVAMISTPPVIRETANAYERQVVFENEMNQPQFVQWQEVADLTRHADRLVVNDETLAESSILCCSRRNIAPPSGLGLPDPFDSEVAAQSVAVALPQLDEDENLVFVIDESVPAGAPVWELIQSGHLAPLPATGTIAEGAYYLDLRESSNNAS